MNSKTAIGVCATIALAIGSASTVANAQPATQAASEIVGVESIVVTARKRQESLLEVPLAITAFSSEQLSRAGVKDLQDLARSVAGLQFSNQGLVIPGRYNSSIRFRGMDVNNSIPTFQLGALFLDGIYVLGSVHSIPLDDVERVEVVKGPQSAYFGRNTFGGAINYITKTPSTTEYVGELQASAATFQEFDVSAAHSGPIVEDKLAYRVGARLYSRGGMFTATDGGKLGKESTKTVQGQLYATPTDSLKLKARVFYGYDHDGPPSGGAIPGRLNDTCSGKTLTTKAGETIRPVRWICGQVPTQGNAISSLGTTKIIDSNTTVLTPRSLLGGGSPDYLLLTVVRKPQPAALADVPDVDAIELRRETFRIAGSAEYEFSNGISATAQGGYNTMKANWVRDYGFTALDNTYTRDPQKQEDYSVEGRILSNQKDRLRWLAGVNYYHQTFLSSAQGGDAVFLCVDSVPGPAMGDCLPNRTSIVVNSLIGSDKVKTIGFFASAAYDLTDQFTLNLEGRYQYDRLTKQGAPTDIVSKTFIPRAIIQFKPNATTNIYASYARGVLPGEINTTVSLGSAAVKAQTSAAGIPEFVPEETLNSYEIGYKTAFFNNRLSVNTAAYYGKWNNRKSRIIFPFNLQCGHPQAPIGAANGCPPGYVGQATLPSGQPALSTLNAIIPGNSEIWGVELEATAAVNEHWTVGGTLDYAGNRFTKFETTVIQPYAGYRNVAGNSAARFPKWSGSLNTTYTAQLSGEWEWFVRGDASYTGRTFVDVDNLAYCKGYWLVNSRAGVERGDLRIELWVKNLLNDKNWAACSRVSEFDTPFDPSYSPTNYQGVVVSPQDKRQIGIKTSIKF